MLFPVHFGNGGWEVLTPAFDCGNFEKITHCHSLCAYRFVSFRLPRTRTMAGAPRPPPCSSTGEIHDIRSTSVQQPSPTAPPPPARHPWPSLPPTPVVNRQGSEIPRTPELPSVSGGGRLGARARAPLSRGSQERFRI
jgi:hypothetical protein